jgi:Glycosyl transferase family 2
MSRRRRLRDVRRRRPAPAEDRIARLEARLEDLVALVQEERAALTGLGTVLTEELRPLLVALARDDAGNRRALDAARAADAYELPYTDPDPLVTISIATRQERLELLLERALPSALSQTHANLEVVVVGDAAGEETRAAVEGVGDERVRFGDLTQRFVHPDGHRHWMTGAIMPRNEARRLARGRWVCDLDDDDALRPPAVERLLALAREERLEVAYGVKERHDPDGTTTAIGTFPPAPLDDDWRERGLPFQPWDGGASCGALVHSGLRFFAREHVAADLGRPGDFFLLERMVRAGVRFGMLDEVVYDYYPSLLWRPSG